MPKCLSREFMDIHTGLKQRVVRSLYYLYPRFAKAAANYSPNLVSLVGSMCLSSENRAKTISGDGFGSEVSSFL